MTVDPFAVTTTVGAVMCSGMSVGLALIFMECHKVFSGGEREALPRPRNDAVHGHICEIADER
jgi:hypothetical protein